MSSPHNEGWVSATQLGAAVVEVMGAASFAGEDGPSRAALVADCLASEGVVAMPSQAPLGLNLKGSTLARCEPAAGDAGAVRAPQVLRRVEACADAAGGARQPAADAATWRYSPAAAALLRAYVAAAPAVAAAVLARLYVDAGGFAAASKFLPGVPHEALQAAAAWRCSQLPQELLRRDETASSERGTGGPASRQRPVPPAEPQPQPPAPPRRAYEAASWRATAPPQQASALQQQRSSGLRVLTRPSPPAAAEPPPKPLRPPLPAAPARSPWAGDAGVAPAAPQPPPLRAILEDEARASAAAAHSAAAATPPSRPAAAAASRAQTSATAPTAAPRVLRAGEGPLRLGWAQVAAAAPKPPATAAAPPLQPPGPPVSAAAAALEQARKSVPDASGRVRCLGCGKAFAAHAQLAQHLGDAHFGKNAPEAARGSRAPSAPLMLSDLLDTATSAAPGRDGTRGAVVGSALANSLFAYVKAAKAKKDAASAAARSGVALGFSARPRAGGERMVNPNAASAAAVVTRRGKERVGGRRKRVTALKKVILRERAAKLAARQAAAPDADGAGAAAAAGDDDVISAPVGDAEAAAPADAEEEAADGVVLHLQRGHVYVSVASAEGGVQLSTIVVEEDDSSSSDEEEEERGSYGAASDEEEERGSSGAASDEEEEEEEGSCTDKEACSGEEEELGVEDGDDMSEEGSSSASGNEEELGVELPAQATAAHSAAQLRAAAAPFVPASARRAEAAAAREVHVCAVCGISAVGAASLQQHMAGRRHRAAAAAAVAAAAGPAAAPAPPPAAPQTYIGPDAALRYGRQVMSRELNASAAAMLSRLMELQNRLRATDPMRAKAKRRVVFGLREAAKAVRSRRAKLLVVVPNVEAVEAPGGLDEALGSLLDAARAGGVPLALALTRAKMGALTGRRVRMSAAVVLDASGAEEAFAQTLALAAAGREQWRKAHPEAPVEAPPQAPAEAEVFLRLRRDGRTRALLPGETAGLPRGGEDAAAAARSCIVTYR